MSFVMKMSLQNSMILFKQNWFIYLYIFGKKFDFLIDSLCVLVFFCEDLSIVALVSYFLSLYFFHFEKG